MAFTFDILVASLFIYACSLAWSLRSRRSRFLRAARSSGAKQAPSYPNRDPLLGLDAFLMLRKADRSGKRFEAYSNLHNVWGPTLQLKNCGFSPEIQTAQPENIQAISATQFSDFGVGPIRGNVGAPFLDRGVFTEDGEFWKHSRALLRPTFSRAEIADLPNFEKHVSRFLALIPRDESSFDIQPLAKRLMLDSSTEFLFGQSVESLLPQTPFETEEFMRSFDYSLLGLALRLLAGPLKPLFALDPTWKRAYTKVHAFVDKHVYAAIEAQIGAERKGMQEAGSSTKYVLLYEMAKETKDPYDLRNQILNVFFPARDTAALAFGNTMFELARHPIWWSRLREEVLGLGPSPSITFELLRNLKVTKAIINETLRLHLAASRIRRTALKDTILPVGGGPECEDPLFIQKGQVIEMDLYTLQRDPRHWGPDSNLFKPERWLDGKRTLWESKWQYAPFLGGMRMCPAQQQVLTQLAYLLVRMAQEFETIVNEDPVLGYIEQIRMTVESRNGVLISLKPAN